jgi:hypothetical protein
MKQFLSAALFGLATLFSLQGQAQSLRENATKEQIAAKLGIEKGQPEAVLRYHLCFEDLRNKAFGVIRAEACRVPWRRLAVVHLAPCA